MEAIIYIYSIYIYIYIYKLLNKRNPYLTSVAYYLDFGNCNPHYLVANYIRDHIWNRMMATINVSRNYPLYQSRTSTGGVSCQKWQFLYFYGHHQKQFLCTHDLTGIQDQCHEMFSTQEITHAEHVAPYTMVHNDISQYCSRNHNKLLDNLCINCEYLCLVCPV